MEVVGRVCYGEGVGDLMRMCGLCYWVWGILNVIL